jgi:hypothetical protein
MKNSTRQQCYISIENDKNIGNQLFNLAYLINVLQTNNSSSIKRKIVFKKDNNLYYKTLFKGLFNILDDEKYNSIDFNKIDIEDIQDIQDIDKVNYATPLNIEHYNKNPEKLSKLYTFKNIDSSLRNKIIELVYSNEDLMYSAYYKYRDALSYFGIYTKDDDVAMLHIMKDADTNIDNDYYNNALSIVKDTCKVTNIAVITDDINWAKIILNDINCDNNYKFYYVPTDEEYNYEINFLLMSMFKNIIVSNKHDCCADSLWASYISYYDNKKVIVPSSIREIHKYITDIV